MSLTRKDGERVEQIATYLHGRFLRRFHAEMAREEERKSTLAKRLIKEALDAREELRHNGAKKNKL